MRSARLKKPHLFAPLNVFTKPAYVTTEKKAVRGKLHVSIEEEEREELRMFEKKYKSGDFIVRYLL